MQEVEDTEMYEKRKMRIFFSILIVLVMIFGLHAGAVYASSKSDEAKSDEEQLSMDVSYGFNNTAKSDRYLRVTVLLNAGTEPFEGTLEFLTEQSSLETYQYSYEVSLQNDEKQEKEYYIPLGVRADRMYVSLKNKEGKTVIRKSLQLGSDDYSVKSYIGIFTDKPGKFSYVDEAGISYGSIKTTAVYLDEKNAPDDRRAYEQFDLVIVSGYELDKLNDVQYEALDSWIENGGTILFGGGHDYKINYGKFAGRVLEPPYLEAVSMPISLDDESVPGEQTKEILTECVDVNLKNGGTLISGDIFPLLSCTALKKGRIVAAAFSMDAIYELCMENPSAFEKLYTSALGDDAVEKLTQEDYYGYSSQYYNVQSLINTGNAGRVPNVAAYTVIVIIYLLLVGPGIYFYLRKSGNYRYYLPTVILAAFLFTGIIYSLGIKTRFKEPFVTCATILDTSGDDAEEEVYLNIRSPYNKQYSVSLSPEYEIRPLTKSYFYDSTSEEELTENDDYYTNITYHTDRTDVKIKENIAFSPNLFVLNREKKRTGKMGFESDISYFDGALSGIVKNCFEEPIEDAALLIDGKVMLLGNLEPGQTINLEDREIYNYPLNYPYVAAQLVSGADGYEKTAIEDPAFLKAQERTRLLSFYMNSDSGGKMSGARLIGFFGNKDQKNNDFLADLRTTSEGFYMVTESVMPNREKDGQIYRSALETTPNVISGNYNSEYNTIYTGDSAATAIVEYSLGGDIIIDKITFETLSAKFLDNPAYPYISQFSGDMYFYNYETGQNDKMDLKEEYLAKELAPYLSPSNTLTVKYVAERTEEYGVDSQLPRIYVVGRKQP